MAPETETAIICVRPAFLLALLDEISRTRALADHETDLVEDIVAMSLPCFRWNPRTDRALLTASISPGGIARFARRFGITGQAAYDRIYRLRKREKGKIAHVKGKG